MLLGCAFHYTTRRVIISCFDMDPVEDMLYSSRPVFTKIISFLSERREEEGREGGMWGGKKPLLKVISDF